MLRFALLFTQDGVLDDLKLIFENATSTKCRCALLGSSLALCLSLGILLGCVPVPPCRGSHVLTDKHFQANRTVFYPYRGAALLVNFKYHWSISLPGQLSWFFGNQGRSTPMLVIGWNVLPDPQYKVVHLAPGRPRPEVDDRLCDRLIRLSAVCAGHRDVDPSPPGGELDQVACEARGM